MPSSKTIITPVLNRATWSSWARSRIRLRALVAAFVPADAPVVLGRDDHSERRQGAKIAVKGIYRAAVRSSKSFFVKTSGLRWVSLMPLAPHNPATQCVRIVEERDGYS